MHDFYGIFYQLHTRFAPGLSEISAVGVAIVECGKLVKPRTHGGVKLLLGRRTFIAGGGRQYSHGGTCATDVSGRADTRAETGRDDFKRGIKTHRHALRAIIALFAELESGGETFIESYHIIGVIPLEIK